LYFPPLLSNFCYSSPRLPCFFFFFSLVTCDLSWKVPSFPPPPPHAVSAPTHPLFLSCDPFSRSPGGPVSVWRRDEFFIRGYHRWCCFPTIDGSPPLPDPPYLRPLLFPFPPLHADQTPPSPPLDILRTSQICGSPPFWRRFFPPLGIHPFFSFS